MTLLPDTSLIYAMSLSISCPPPVVGDIHGLLAQSGGPTVIRDEIDDRTAFVAMNEQEAYTYLCAKFGSPCRLGPRPKTPPRRHIPHLLTQLPCDPTPPILSMSTTGIGLCTPTHTTAGSHPRPDQSSATVPGSGTEGDQVVQQTRTSDEEERTLQTHAALDQSRSSQKRGKREAAQRLRQTARAEQVEPSRARKRRRTQAAEAENGSDQGRRTAGRTWLLDQEESDTPELSLDGIRFPVPSARRWLEREVGSHKDPTTRQNTDARLQDAMVQKAAAVGSLEALVEAQIVYASWRKNGSPFARTSPMSTLPPFAPTTHARAPAIQDLTPATTAFVEAWEVAKEGQAQESLQAVLHRKRYMDVHDAYCAAEAVADEAVVGQQGVGRRSTAKVALFHAVYPQHTKIPNPRHDHTTKADYQRFGRMLDYCRRWVMLRDVLGPTRFMLMPVSKVPNTFIEQDLTVAQLHLWARLVLEFSHTTRIQSVVDDAMVPYLNGEPAPSWRLRLEDSHRVALSQTPDLGTLWAPIDLTSRSSSPHSRSTKLSSIWGLVDLAGSADSLP